MSEDTQRLEFVSDRGDARLRLDQVLVRRIGREIKLSRTQAQLWIHAGFVALNDEPARRSSQSIQEGTHVAVDLPPSVPRRAAPAAEDLPLDVLFEDDDLLVINKPPGMVVHPTYKHASSTLINAVLWRLRDRLDARPGVLTRLDKDTSGLVVVALSPTVHASLQTAAKAGRVLKDYLAVVHGTPYPTTGRITLPLGRDAQDRRRVVARPDGAASETRYRMVSNDGRPAAPVAWLPEQAPPRNLSVVRCQLVTGRTHQIRVHLATSGWPIVGDPTYGSPSPLIGRQALHAWQIDLQHPVTGKAMTITAPPPPDMKAVLSAAGWPPGTPS
jgi:23S rRNA pseudouridine1911/1915/1917 synthase